MTKTERKRIDQALEDRQTWADRQQTWFAMRAGTIKRKVKPYKNAPDVRYQLCDALIEKVKPAYLSQPYAGEHIYSFRSLKQQDETVTQGCEAYFDFNLKQRSNFERTLAIAVDQKCECGFTVVKARWDAEESRLSFSQIDPLHFIVPQSTQELNEEGGADWCVHVLHMSEAEYRANQHYVQDDGLIKRLKGRGQQDDAGKLQEKDQKEGINCSDDENEIVLWEFYNRDRVKGRIMVETVSPLLDEQEHDVRTPFQLPYNRGCFKSGQHFPFFQIRYELKGKGWYSSRGIMEINQSSENSLSKDWNTILQWSDFYGNPLLKNEGSYEPPNAHNFRTKPGSILPPGLAPVDPPSAPEFLRQNMDLVRALAEQRTGAPDLTASEHLTGNVPATKTATGINAVVAQSGQGTDMKARVYALYLAQGGKIAWSILIQYATAPNMEQSLLEYVADGQVTAVDIQHLTDAYEITPNASADSWNKAATVNKRLTMRREFAMSPFINQGEMDKWTLEAEDPRLVKRLYRDPQDAQHDQEFQQMLENVSIGFGYTPHVKPSDDDKTHLMIEDQFVQLQIANGTMTPQIAQGLLQHGMEHMEALKQKKDKMLPAIEQKLGPTVQLLQQFMAQMQPSNVMPFQQPTGADQSQQSSNPAASSQAAGPPSPTEQPINQ